MAKKLHPADAADRAKIATATHFNVHLRRSPTSKINREAPTLAEAAKVADEIAAEFGKAPMIYAVTPDQMTVFVPKDMVEAAKAGEPAADAIPDCVPAFLVKDASSRKAAISARDGAAPAKGDDHPAPAAKPAKAKKAAAAKPAAPKAEAPAGGKRAAALEAAQRGELPAAPDFSAETHKRFRAKLAGLVAMAEAGDIAGLKAAQINPVSSSPKAMAKYRDLAVIALEAKAAA